MDYSVSFGFQFLLYTGNLAAAALEVADADAIDYMDSVTAAKQKSVAYLLGLRMAFPIDNVLSHPTTGSWRNLQGMQL